MRAAAVLSLVLAVWSAPAAQAQEAGPLDCRFDLFCNGNSCSLRDPRMLTVVTDGILPGGLRGEVEDRAVIADSRLVRGASPSQGWRQFWRRAVGAPVPGDAALVTRLAQIPARPGETAEIRLVEPDESRGPLFLSINSAGLAMLARYRAGAYDDGPVQQSFGACRDLR